MATRKVFTLRKQDISRILTRRQARKEDYDIAMQVQAKNRLLIQLATSDYLTVVRCRECNEVLVVGDRVVSKLSGGGQNNKSHYYHEVCAERLHII